jgi:outer membrane protein TolC
MRKLVIIALFCLGVQVPGLSQSLEEYLRIAAENNPELKAYFNDYSAALERVPQVGSLPDPELDMGFFLRPMEFPMGNQRAQFQLMQMFPWFGSLDARKDEASKMALAQYETFQDAQNRLLFRVKNTWYQLYELEEEIRIVQENLEILNQYERLALVRYQNSGTSSGSGGMPRNSSMNEESGSSSSGGMGTMGGNAANTGTSGTSTASRGTSTTSPAMGGGSGMSDVLRVKMEIKELENTLALLSDSRFPLQAEFNQLLNRDINANVIILDTLDATPLAIERLALLDSITQNNPMLKMLDAEEQAYEAQKRMAKLEGRPMLGVGVTYMLFSPHTENGTSMGGDDMVMPMVRLTIPIYRKKYNAMYRESELRQTAVRQRRENTVNQLSTEWASAIRTLDDAQRRVRLYREQTDLAKQTLNLLMISYSTEGREFEEVLQVQQQLLDYQLRWITAIVDQYTTLAMLENLAASNLN